MPKYDIPEQDRERPEELLKKEQEQMKKAGRKAKEAGGKVVKRGIREGVERAGKKLLQKLSKEAVKQAAKRAAQYAATEATAAVAATGPPGWLILLIILAVILILIFLVIVVFLLIVLVWGYGWGGKGTTIPVNPNNPTDQAIYSEYKGLLDSGKLKILNPRDKEYVDNSFSEKGDAKSSTRIDKRVLKSLNYLAKKHELITVGAIISPYEDMPIDTIETIPSRNNQVIKNISAHKSGQAADIWEIDKVYKYCECSEQCGCDRIPVQIRWQDDQPASSASAQGSARQSMISNLELSMGLPRGTLSATDVLGNVRNTGAARLEQALGLPAGSIEGGNLESVLQTEGQRELEEYFGLPPGSLEGATLSQQSTNIGAKDIERLLNLPYGSLTGGNLENVAIGLGQKRIEKELGLPEGTIARKDIGALSQKILQQNITPQDLAYLETSFAWPTGSLQNVIATIQNGGDPTQALIDIGEAQLSSSLGIPLNYLNPFGPGLPVAQINAKEAELGLPQNTLVDMINRLRTGQDIAPMLQSLGLTKLEQSLELAPNTLGEFITGGISWQELIAQSEIDYSALTQDLGISLPFAQSIIEGIVSGNYGSYGSLYGLNQNFGQQKIESYLGLPSGSIDQILSGQATPESIANLAGVKFSDLEKAWNLPVGSLNGLLSGNINGIIQDVGTSWLAEVSDVTLVGWQNMLNGDFSSILQSNMFGNLAGSWGFNPNMIVGMFSGGINTSSLIQLGINYFFPGFGGLMGGFIGGMLGGMFGGGCSTDCYRPTARANTHKVIEELLNMPAELNDKNMKVRQIITFSQERDVDPFESKLDEVYGSVRTSNYGLFSMKEAWKNIHIGY